MNFGTKMIIQSNTGSDNENIRPIIFKIIPNASSTMPIGENKHSPSVVFKSTSFLYFHTFSRISYYMLMSPYKSILEKTTDDYGILRLQLRLQMHPLQKILCGVMHFMAILLSTFVMCTEVVKRPKTISEDPSSLFSVGRNVMHYSALWIYVCLCWFKRIGLRRLYEITYRFSTFENYKAPFIKNTESMAVIFIAGICIYLSISSLSGYIYPIVTQIKNNVFPFSHAEGNGFIILDYFLSACVFIPIFYVSMLSHVVLIEFPALSCLAVYNIGTKFSNTLKQNPHFSFSEVVSCINQVRELVSNINEVMGMQIIMFVASAIINFTSSLIEVLDYGDFLSRFNKILYTIQFVLFIIIAANGSAKIQEYAEYFYNKKDEPSFKDNLGTLVVMSELSSNPIGLKAYKFPITFGFGITILSQIITYTVILIQFSAGKPPGLSYPT